jgi:hypothetical protein
VLFVTHFDRGVIIFADDEKHGNTQRKEDRGQRSERLGSP